MRRPKATTRVRWMAPISPGEASPMDKVVAWLERNGDVYRASKRKLDMLEQVGEELETSGIYGLSVSAIRSQLTRLKHQVRLKAEGGLCTATDANRYYDRLLVTLFDEDERAAMRARADERATEEATEPSAARSRPLLRTSRRSRSRHSAPREATQQEAEATDDSDAEDQESEHAGADAQPILGTTEIRRRFELLSARRSLQRQGVDQETIDAMLPLRL
jgi:hypothetical protein